jgi:hypothetical protein
VTTVLLKASSLREGAEAAQGVFREFHRLIVICEFLAHEAAEQILFDCRFVFLPTSLEIPMLFTI